LLQFAARWHTYLYELVCFLTPKGTHALEEARLTYCESKSVLAPGLWVMTRDKKVAK